MSNPEDSMDEVQTTDIREMANADDRATQSNAGPEKLVIRRIPLFLWPRGYTRLAMAVAVYGAAAAFFIYRGSALFDPEHSWVLVPLVLALTVLVAALRTGTGLALVLAYAFVSATVMALQGYRLGWTQVMQLQNITDHLAGVVFLASAVAVSSITKSTQSALTQAKQIITRYITEDETTGLLTPDAFRNAVSRELNRSRRTSHPFVVLAIDMSGYFQPAHGSLSLESSRKMLGTLLSAKTRSNYDLWTMWKEDLYLGLLIETDERAVRPVLDRLIDHITKAPEFDGAALVEKARFAFSTYPGDNQTLETLLSAAMADMVPLRGAA